MSDKGFHKKTSNGERIILAGDFTEKISKSEVFMDGEEVDAIILACKKDGEGSRILLAGDMNNVRENLLSAMMTDNDNPFNEVHEVAKNGIDIGSLLKDILSGGKKECDCPKCTLPRNMKKEGPTPENMKQIFEAVTEEHKDD